MEKEIINYLIFGVLTTIVSLLVYYGLTLTILNPEKALELQIANVISWIAAVTFAYFTNRKWVFENKDKANLKEASKFYLSRVSTLLIDMGLMFIFVVLGIIGGGFIDQIDTDIVKERKNEYKELVDTNQLDNRTRKKALAKEERRKKAEQERKELEESSKNKQAVE